MCERESSHTHTHTLWAVYWLQLLIKHIDKELQNETLAKVPAQVEGLDSGSDPVRPWLHAAPPRVFTDHRWWCHMSQCLSAHRSRPLKMNATHTDVTLASN